MTPPPWLQELRDVLAMTGADIRQEAFMAWEQRWLVDLHAQQVVSQRELETGRLNTLEQTAGCVRHQLGEKLADLMVEITRVECSEPPAFLAGMIEIRGNVLAIRREPNLVNSGFTDDDRMKVSHE